MVIDASAIVAILRGEPEDKIFADVISDDPMRHMSPVNWFEAAIAAEKYDDADFVTLEKLATRIGLVIVPVTEEHMRLAHRAWLRFGKGRDKAKLNLGDCFAYALARSLDEPLLYKGRDFSRTDVRSAL
jgi:ribonuclease VapC